MAISCCRDISPSAILGARPTGDAQDELGHLDSSGFAARASHSPRHPTPQHMVDWQEQERLLRFLLQFLARLEQINDPCVILQRLCDELVDASPHIRLAWVWLGDQNVTTIEPQIIAGPARAYAQTLRIHRSKLTAQGPVFQALLHQSTRWIQISTDSPFAPWQEAADRYGFRQAVALPLHLQQTGQYGVVVFYADTDDYFERIGLEPFQAFVQLGEVALRQSDLFAQLARHATSDPLTGLLNRRGMEHALKAAFDSAQSSNQGFGLVLLDLDRFKLINDSYGHPAGDAVLRQVAELLRELVRQGDAIARWGGEEFLILLPQQTLETTHQTAQRLREAIATMRVIHGQHTIHLTASLGIATWSGSSCTLERLTARLDSLLYDAKRSGRNKVKGFGGVESHVLSQGAQIQNALDTNRIGVAYQPLMQLESNQVVGYEALARMWTPDGQVIAASAFISAAHRLRLEHRIDAAVSQQALQHCFNAHLEDAQSTRKHLINCSADFLSRPDCIDTLLRTAEAHRTACGTRSLVGSHVIIEITERQILGHPQETLALLQPLLDFGFELAVDDFGSGYSSFLYLLDLPVRYLKIEMELVQRAAVDPKARVMVRSIQTMAQDLGILTIAEGIETEVQRDLMREIGIAWGQGYLWGKPGVDLPRVVSA